MPTHHAPEISETVAQPTARHTAAPPLDATAQLLGLQRAAGNRATSRALANLGSLEVGRPDDRYEREAEQVSRQLLDAPAPTIAQPLARLAGRSPAAGEPLPPPVRELMEPRFGTDFSGVQVHTDPAADALNQSLGSRAFTTSQDIYFRRGEYDPASAGGQRLLAHELTHVVQQSSPRGHPRISRAPLSIQRMILKMVGRGIFENLNPRRAQDGEKAQYDLSIPDDKRAVERHWEQQRLLEEEDDQRRRAEQPDEEEPGPLLLQEQLLLPPQGQIVGHQHGQGHVPDVTVDFSGAEYIERHPDRIVASSKNIDLHAAWTPGPTPPDGHSPNAVVGWVQNIFHQNKQADYFDDHDQYVESSFKEYNGQLIDGDDADSPWYDPPRPYQEVRSAEALRLFGGKQLTGARGIPLSDKPQDYFPLVSPRGGKLYRFGGESTFIAYLVMTEPDGSQPTVLEWVAWKYEYAYTLRALPLAERGPSYQRPTDFETLYADTRVTGRAVGVPPTAPVIVVNGEHGNVFFDHLRPTWEDLPAGRDPYDHSRFPSFI